MINVHIRAQSGMATIAVALILLFGISVITLFANRVVLFDIKMSSNQFSAGKAFQAAETGLEKIIASMQDMTWRSTYMQDANFNNNKTIVSDSLTGTDMAFKVTIERVQNNSNLLLKLESLGCSEGCTPCNETCPSKAKVVQYMRFKPYLSGAPSAPMTAKGNIQTGGNADIINQDPSTTGLTVHAGGGNVQVGSATLTTLPGTPPAASIAKNDQTLSSLSDDQFFMEFFGDTKENVKNSADLRINCNGTCNTELSGHTGKLIYVTGNTQISSNLTIGSPTAPVVLIVDGELKITGNVQIHGIVYCTAIVWDNTGMGTVNIYGGAVAEGSFTGNGTPTITYDTGVLNKLNKEMGRYAKVLGTWRDFD
ncbi:MAG: pilus assembly PilX N-terminal domain-containing protein [Candidatus Hadarchaeum sp.]